LLDKSKYLLLLLLGLFVLAISPALLSTGMFMDGIIYASIAENLSNGIGSVWTMKFTETSGPFNGHPPLAMYLESLFFKLLGNHVWVEKMYSLLTVIVSSIIASIIFRKFYSENKNSYPLVFFFLLTMPLFYWISTNNLLENTMAIFTTLSIYFFVQHEKNYVLNSLLGGAFIYLAFITKGVVALFPFSVPFWLFVFRYINLRKFLYGFMLSIFGFSLVAIMVHLLAPESTAFFKIYFQEQVVDSIQQRATVNSRYQIIVNFLAEIIIGLVILGGMIFFTRRKVEHSKLKSALFFTAISLSGVLPMMVSMKQSGFYIYPALPMIAIALAILAEPYFQKYLEKIYAYKFLKHLSFSVLAIAILVSLFFKNSMHRDKELIEDVNNISALLSNKNTINVGQGIKLDYYTHCYFYRLHKKSLALNTNDSLKMLKVSDVTNQSVVYKGNLYSLVKN
jgi:4-amino-4-deoxy-L-arabinose transferase-like glycosyltransferase